MNLPREKTMFALPGLVVLGVLSLFLTPPVGAQAVRWKPDPGVKPPLLYRGLVPGISTARQVREACGEPTHEALWYAYKMLYAVSGSPGMFDAMHLESKDGQDGTLSVIESATIPAGWETEKQVREKLGAPEFHLEWHRQSLLDYSEKGLRFIFDLEGDTIGIAHVPHGRRRVHAGERRHLSLRGLRQGSQPAPEKAGSLGGLRAGAAVVDVSPRDPAWLGTQVRAEDFQVVQPLEARCAVLEREGQTVAIVGADLFGMSLSEIEPVRRKLREQGVDHLFLAMSHNHAAPDTIGIYGVFPKQYVDFLQARILEGVLRAKERLAPVASWVAGSDELSLGGARVVDLARNARNPGLVDPQLAVLQARGSDGRAIVTFVHFTCHPEGLRQGATEISPDFPGTLCHSLAESEGGVAVFLNGALGGMVTGDTRARTHEESRRAGALLADHARRILETAVSPERFDFQVEVRRLEVPLTNPRFILFMKMSGRRSLVEGRVATEMACLRLGEADLVTVPGELLPEVGVEILERMDGYPRMVIGLTNDQLGYMIPASDFRSGSYEESMSVGPAIAPLVKEQAHRLLEFLRASR